MRETAASKSQKRALRVLDLADAETYAEAASILESAGVYRDGIPVGHTWRTAAKLSDSEVYDLLKDSKTKDDAALADSVPDYY